jgi:hypothetical protein
MAFNRPTLVLYSIAMVCLFSVAGAAQTYSLSGKVTDTTTHAVPSATVSARSVAEGKTYTAHTNADGAYNIPNLPAGDYEVWAKAGELKAEPVKVTLAAGQTTDLVVSPVPRP